MNIELRPFTESDMPLFISWLKEEHGEAYNGDIPKEGTYSIDYLIGNTNHLNKGIRSKAIKIFNSFLPFPDQKELLCSQKTIIYHHKKPFFLPDILIIRKIICLFLKLTTTDKSKFI